MEGTDQATIECFVNCYKSMFGVKPTRTYTLAEMEGWLDWYDQRQSEHDAGDWE